jgi:hypothetical protein
MLLRPARFAAGTEFRKRNKARGIVMRNTLLPVLLAVATLAMLNRISFAGEVSPVPESHSAAPPAGEAACSDSLFVDNGWDCISLCDFNKPVTDCSQPIDCGSTCGDSGGGSRRITADVELMALRTHFSEDPLGKLGEKYELSERMIVGMENENGIGGRVRYWTYDRTTPNLQGGSSLRADFDVIDFEGTTRFGTQNFDLMLSGGVRWADIKIDIDRGRCRNDMPGASFGLDLRGIICRDCHNGLVWRSVSGARLSVFGGDWELSRGLIGSMRDDNIMVTEIYGGVECTHCCHGHDLYARLVFETQNWRSDALGESTGIDSIGFVGPGLNLGLNY